MNNTELLEIARKGLELESAIPKSHSDDCKLDIRKWQDGGAVCTCGYNKAVENCQHHTITNFPALCHYVLESLKEREALLQDKRRMDYLVAHTRVTETYTERSPVALIDEGAPRLPNGDGDLRGAIDEMTPSPTEQTEPEKDL